MLPGMRLKDWLLFLVIGIGAYALGFQIGHSPRWRDWLFEGDGAELALIIDSIEIPEHALDKLGTGYPAVTVKWLPVKTREGFSSSSPIADGALARVEWLETADRKVLPAHQLLPKLEQRFFSYFRREKYLSAHIVPLLWGVPAVRGPKGYDLAKATAGVRRSWPFLPLSDFISFAPTETGSAPFELGVWNSLAPKLAGSDVLLVDKVARRAVVLGLILFDTPNTRKPGSLRWLEGLTESPLALSEFLKTGLGVTLIPAEGSPRLGIPPEQWPEAITRFELDRIE